MACQGSLEDFLAYVEFRFTELVVDSPKVGDQALVGGALEDSDGADDGDANGQRLGAGFLFIQQEGVGMNLLGQADGITFPAMTSEGGIRRHRRRAYADPRWRLCHPISDNRRRGGVG